LAQQKKKEKLFLYSIENIDSKKYHYFTARKNK